MSRNDNVMRMLGEALPAELDSCADPVRRELDLAAAFAQPRPVQVTRRQWTLSRQVRLGAATLGGAAAVSLAVVVAVLLASAAPPHAGSTVGAGPGGATGYTAPTLLLAAAQQAATAKPTIGRYWRVEQRGGRLIQVGPADNRYVVTATGRSDRWTATSAGGPGAFVWQSLGAHPATPADEAAWKRDGSPTRWDTISSVGKPQEVKAAADPALVKVTSLMDWSFVTGGRLLSMQQIRNLPTDPEALRSFLLVDRSAGGVDETQFLFDAGSQILTDLPVPPAVRAAAYRMLAALPGVRYVGPLDDPSGRHGHAIAVTQTRPDGSPDEARSTGSSSSTRSPVRPSAPRVACCVPALPCRGSSPAPGGRTTSSRAPAGPTTRCPPRRRRFALRRASPCMTAPPAPPTPAGPEACPVTCWPVRAGSDQIPTGSTGRSRQAPHPAIDELPGPSNLCR